jgi:hypothetical protein
MALLIMRHDVVEEEDSRQCLFELAKLSNEDVVRQ